jgi:hypothetical protein
MTRSRDVDEDLGHDGGTRAIGGQLERPPLPPARPALRVWLSVGVAAARFGFPADPAVRLVLDHVVDHLVVAQLVDVHVHHEDVSHAADRGARHHAPHHSRTVELAVPARVGQDREDDARGCADPPRYGDGLVFTPGHERLLRQGSMTTM